MVIASSEGERDERGLCHGLGRATLTSGAQYEGTFVHGRLSGEGKMLFPDGIQYEGDFLDNAITGSGVYRWPNIVYAGAVLDGKRHGQGRLEFTDTGSTYEGGWVHGVRHGVGTLYFDASQQTYYSGEWAADMKHGHGAFYYANGNVYDGQWADDRKEGQGIMFWKDRMQRYGGEWRNNQPNGLGEHVWLHSPPDAASTNVNTTITFFVYNRYVGMFRDSKKHGEGALFYSNGGRYEGEWRADRKHGDGVLVFENGTVFSGNFEDDKPVVDAASRDLFMGYGPKSTAVRSWGAGPARAAARRPSRRPAAPFSLPANSKLALSLTPSKNSPLINPFNPLKQPLPLAHTKTTDQTIPPRRSRCLLTT